ncbi:MAG: hypothetical protein ACRD1V_20175 [Vicinamibacterales bacterium]
MPEVSVRVEQRVKEEDYAQAAAILDVTPSSAPMSSADSSPWPTILFASSRDPASTSVRRDDSIV